MDEFTFYGVYSSIINKDLLSFYKFKCKTISDVIVIPNNHFLSKLVEENNKYDPLIIAFTGYDGYMRVLDIENLTPIFSFKSNFGGFNSVVLDTTENSTLCVLGC